MTGRAGLSERVVPIGGRHTKSPPSPGLARSAADASIPAREHVVTVALEDYFHAAPFRPWVREEIWYRFEDRLGASARRMLELFHRCDVRATFFVTARTAEAAPDLVREIVSQGHEIAAAGDHGRDLRKLDRQRFRSDAADSRTRIEQIVGHHVLGYRIASAWLSHTDVWILEALAEAGYRYDSSVRPAMFSNPDLVWRRSQKPQDSSSQPFFELPVSSIGLFGLNVPIAGGGPFRHFPESVTRRVMAHWDRHRPQPYVMYLRTWELDAEQPRLSAPPLHARIRQYHNLDRMPRLLEEVLSSYQFTTAARHLGLEIEPMASGGVLESPPTGPVELFASNGHQFAGNGHEISTPVVTTAVSVVIPCYNETQSLGYLSKTLTSVTEKFRDRYSFTFLFVDDCSTDATWPMLQDLFGTRPGFVLLRHQRNLGVAAAIHTGIRHTVDDIVCSIDCDCTYDPHELGRMIPMLEDGVDVVTASPYHPAGHVRNVPAWRLFLSRGLSRLYRAVLRQKLHTYTSCFRVYRRQSVAPLELRLPGYLGLTELIARVDFAGKRVVECPSTLEVRVLGFSKMKVLRNIAGHLGLLAGLVRRRLFQRKGAIATEYSF